MLKRTVLSAFCAAALLVTGVVSAQENATLTLRSGERVSGQLVDLGGVGYTIRVNGTDRQIPQNNVAVIDFTGGTMSDADWARFTGTSQVVLRNGQTIDGQLYDIGGTSPLRLTIKTNGGDRDMASNEVARIVIARPDNVTTGTTGSNPSGITPTQPVAGAITVAANQPWTNTGRTVRKGQPINVASSGEIQLSTSADDIATPAGAKSGRQAVNAPVKNATAGALIGRIGPRGAPFAIGNQSSVVAPASGVLFLGINDDGFADNQGNFQVVIR